MRSEIVFPYTERWRRRQRRIYFHCIFLFLLHLRLFAQQQQQRKTKHFRRFQMYNLFTVNNLKINSICKVNIVYEKQLENERQFCAVVVDAVSSQKERKLFYTMLNNNRFSFHSRANGSKKREHFFLLLFFIYFMLRCFPGRMCHICWMRIEDAQQRKIRTVTWKDNSW